MSFPLYSLIRFAHIVSACILVGHSIANPVIRRGILQASTGADVASLVTLAGRLGRINPITAMILLASGIFLGRDGSWATGWFAVAVIAWIVNSALAPTIVAPGYGAIAKAAGRCEGKVDASLDRVRRSEALRVGEEVILGNDIAILYVMIDRPPLMQSIVIVLVCIAVALASSVVGRLRASAELPVPSHDTAVAERL